MLQVRLWQLGAEPNCSATLSGHKSAVTALCFNADSSLLASASRDTNITIWDVAAEAGLFKLRGHQDEVTDLVSLAANLTAWDACFHCRFCQEDFCVGIHSAS